jgi:hypothetical protein
MEWSDKILSELKHLEVVYEQWDPEDEESFYTDSFILLLSFENHQRACQESQLLQKVSAKKSAQLHRGAARR